MFPSPFALFEKGDGTDGCGVFADDCLRKSCVQIRMGKYSYKLCSFPLRG